MYSRHEASSSARSMHVPVFDARMSLGVRSRWLCSEYAGGGLMYCSRYSFTSAVQIACTCASTPAGRVLSPSASTD